MARIKVRLVGSKQWAFLTGKGGTNRLRIHAAVFETRERAQALVDENKAENPEWEWRIAD